MGNEVVKQVVAVFLKQFNYLDANDKRAGFCIKFFTNTALSEKIAEVARQCEKDISNCESLDAFIEIVKHSQHMVWAWRWNMSEVRHYKVIEGDVEKTYYMRREFNKGRFEENMLKGLAAVVQLNIDEIDPTKASQASAAWDTAKILLSEFENEIKQYQPKKLHEAKNPLSVRDITLPERHDFAASCYERA